MQLPEQVKFIISELNKNGYEGYIVGGCVRDYLMGIPPHDYDITTSALPEEVKAIFPHTVDTGIEHGTVTVIIDKIGYELTTYRIDGEYKDNRHPEQVIFTDKLAGDLSRRDFTVNAIAYNDQRGYVDMFGGMEDIKKAIIKGVGEPSKRFQEDALRMMRALRFSAQLNFSIEENTMLALKENAQLIKNISIERIREEFFKLIISDHNERLDLLYESGMLPYFLPELKKIIEDNSISYTTINTLSKDICVRLAYVFHTLDSDNVKKILHNFRTDNKTNKITSQLVKYIDFEITDKYSLRKLISILGENTEHEIEIMGAVKGIDTSKAKEMYSEIISAGDCCNLKSLAINGNDLKELGIDHGKEVGEYLAKALDFVLKNPHNNQGVNYDYCFNYRCYKWHRSFYGF